MYSLPHGDCCWGCRVVEHGTSLVCGDNCGSFCSGKSRSRAHKVGIEQGCALRGAAVDAEDGSLDSVNVAILGHLSN
jgi:hypothetical protein